MQVRANAKNLPRSKCPGARNPRNSWKHTRNATVSWMISLREFAVFL